MRRTREGSERDLLREGRVPGCPWMDAGGVEYRPPRSRPCPPSPTLSPIPRVQAPALVSQREGCSLCATAASECVRRRDMAGW